LAGVASSAEKYEIGSIQIEIEGIGRLKQSDIRRYVRLREGDSFDLAVTGKRAYEDATVIGALTSVASVSWKHVVVDDKIRLIFEVTEENFARSIDFKFVGTRSYKDKKLKDVLSKFGLKENGYLVKTAESGKDELKVFYLKEGYRRLSIEEPRIVTVRESPRRKVKEVDLVYTINEGPRVVIGRVKFEGNKLVKTSVLAKAVEAKKKKWLIFPKPYARQIVAEDVNSLKTVYRERGFLDPKITWQTEFTRGGRRACVTFLIEEGPVYSVGEISLSGAKKIYELIEEQTLRDKLTLKSGESYNEVEAELDADELLRLYREYGFVDAQVQLLEPKRIADFNVVDVEFAIEENDRFRIGRIDITGNEYTPDKAVRRILDEYDFQPGKYYNAQVAPVEGAGQIEADMRVRLSAETASISPFDSGVPGQKNVVVDINEGPTALWMPGAGFSTDSGFIGRLVYEQVNFNIADWPGNLFEFLTLKPPSKGGGQRLSVRIEPGVEVSQYELSFTEPYFRDKPVKFDVTGLSYERKLESYDLGRLHGYFGFEERYQWRYRQRWRKSIGFRAEDVQVEDVDDDAPREIKSVEGGNALYGVKLGIKRDLTDNRFTPSKGTVIRLAYEQLSGDDSFGILSGTHQWYKTLSKDFAQRKTVLRTRLLGAATVGSAPPYEKFYAGGAGRYGIRGFEYRGVSTRGLQTNVTNPKKKDPIGSDWIFLANAEVAVPISKENFYGLFFVDSGIIDTGNYRVAVGTGVEIRIPWLTGPVPMRLTVATPIMKEEEDETEVFNFSAGIRF
jgi:outer membrane protein insertion porin family